MTDGVSVDSTVAPDAEDVCEVNCDSSSGAAAVIRHESLGGGLWISQGWFRGGGSIR